jgi:hypothetical protein
MCRRSVLVFAGQERNKKTHGFAVGFEQVVELGRKTHDSAMGFV